MNRLIGSLGVVSVLVGGCIGYTPWKREGKDHWGNDIKVENKQVPFEIKNGLSGRKIIRVYAEGYLSASPAVNQTVELEPGQSLNVELNQADRFRFFIFDDTERVVHCSHYNILKQGAVLEVTTNNEACDPWKTVAEMDAEVARSKAEIATKKAPISFGPQQCKAWRQKISTGCGDHRDCKAIIGGHSTACETQDCKAIIMKQSTACATEYCKAILAGKARLCD